MTYVTGIGGFFFRAKDPEALARWYHERLGLPIPPTTYEQQPWRQDAGTTIFQPFPADTDYFGDPQRQWMLNFRVRSLNVLVKALREAGETVELDPETYPNGRFARLTDLEGNSIQLWEPGGLDPG